jgi:hypothetical protein
MQRDHLAAERQLARARARGLMAQLYEAVPAVTGVRFSVTCCASAGRRLLVGGDDGGLRVYEAKEGSSRARAERAPGAHAPLSRRALASPRPRHVRAARV